MFKLFKKKKERKWSFEFGGIFDMEKICKAIEKGKVERLIRAYLLFTIIIICFIFISLSIDKLKAEINREGVILDYRIARILKVKTTPVLGIVKTITAYNLVPEQTDDTPEIGSCNVNIKDMVDDGIAVCAGNYPCGTKIYIENFGECLILDSLSDKYKNRIDIAMKADEIQQAKNWGKQYLKVKIYE